MRARRRARSARGSPRAGRRRRAPRRARGVGHASHSAPPATAGCPGRCGRSGPRPASSTSSTASPARPRGVGEAARHRRRHDVVAAAVGRAAPGRRAGRRSVGEASRVAHGCSSGPPPSRSPTTPSDSRSSHASSQVDDAGLGDRRRHRHARRRARRALRQPRPRRRPRGQVPARGVPDRDHAGEVEPRVGADLAPGGRSPPRRPRRSSASRRRDAPEPAVLDVPRRPAARREVAAPAGASACARSARARTRRGSRRRRGTARRRRARRARRTGSGPARSRAARRACSGRRTPSERTRLGQPRDALVDLLRRHARVGQPQRVVARPRAGSPCP